MRLKFVKYTYIHTINIHNGKMEILTLSNNIKQTFNKDDQRQVIVGNRN